MIDINSLFLDFSTMSDEELIEVLKDQKHANLVRKPNYNKIPVTNIGINYHGMNAFNRILDYFEGMEGMGRIIRTRSGGISTKGFQVFPQMDIRLINTCVELTVLCGLGMFRFQFRTGMQKETGSMYGHTAMKVFKKVCERHGVDFNSMAIENGKQVKEQIEKPLLAVLDDEIMNKAIGDVHHIDVHSAWAAFAVKEYPELKPVYEELFAFRKTNKVYKLVIVESLGMMQSLPMTRARWSHIPKAGINGTNHFILDLAKKMIAEGRKPILFNTDGIWYQGEIYHGEGEGKKLGEWENDHTDCIIRIKGPRAYEYVDGNGKYTCVLSGTTKLDAVKPRDQWTWGDLYHEQAEIIKFYWDMEKRRIFVYE